MKSPHEYAGNRPRYVPASTYRLQVHREFPLTDATAIVPYLSRLGVSACYTSPYFTAAPGSTHGYDVADHNQINPEVGGAEAHGAFTAALARYEMGHVVDFVPNHMGIGTGNNARWNDLLENGPSSPSAIFFDVDWSPVKAELHAKLLLPILGDQVARSRARRTAAGVRRRVARAALLRADAADQRPGVVLGSTPERSRAQEPSSAPTACT